MTTETSRVAAPGGHVFVVHGLLESLVHDAAIVPTSGSFEVRRYWKPLLGGSRSGTRPKAWPTDFARSARHENIWFLSVGGMRRTDRARGLAMRVADCVEAIAESGISAQQGRVRPLVALPVVGIEGGGLGSQRGEVIRLLLDELTARVARLGVDVVVVARDSAVHAAAQHLRLQNPGWNLSAESLAHAKRLGEAARNGDLALFFGAGVSVPAGLPTWHDLLGILAEEQLDPEDLRSLSVLDQAQLLEHMLPGLSERVAAITKSAKRPSLAHALLASLRCREAVTTNYDRLYEQAVKAAGSEVASVLPWEAVGPSRRWVLKMHGDHEVKDSIVLTRGDYVRYDAITRPSGAVLQALLLTRHVMIVGASLTDDNVVRLAYEVDAYRRNSNREGRYGTLLDVEGKAMMSQLWKGQLDWVEMEGDEFVDRARTLEVFLDAVSAYASKDSSWLLDERFAHLLSDDKERQFAEEVRMLSDSTPSGDAWEPLRRLLQNLGAAHD